MLGEGLDLRRDGAGGAGDELNDVAVLGRLDQRLAPPAKSDDARFDHTLCSATRVTHGVLRFAAIRPIAISANRYFGQHHLGHVSTASATHASIQNTQYSMPPITQIHFLVTL